MTIDPDTYAMWGDWHLDQFKVQIAWWRDNTHPPAEVVDRVAAWWPGLRQPAEWSGAARVSRDRDPEGNLHWMWVPDAKWLDEEAGFFRAQCWFRVYEAERPPRLECVEFRAVRSLTPAEVNRADEQPR